MSSIGVENVCYLQTCFDKNNLKSKSKIAIEKDTFVKFGEEMNKYGFKNNGVTELSAAEAAMYLQGLNLIMPEGTKLKNPITGNHTYELHADYDWATLHDTTVHKAVVDIKPHTFVERTKIAEQIDEQDKETIVRNLYLYV